MNIFLAHVCLEFEEPDLSAPFPACLPFVAAALACGWRLAKDGSPNHTDALFGVEHVQNFKHASPRKLCRLITFRFVARTLNIEGESVSLGGFIQRCQEDKAYFRTAKAQQWYERWFELLKEAMMEERRSLLASHDSHDRKLIVPMRGAAPDIVHRFAVMYESSWE